MNDQPEETWPDLPSLPPEFTCLIGLPDVSTFEQDSFETDPLGWVDKNLWI